MAGDMMPALAPPWPDRDGVRESAALHNYPAEQALLGQILSNNRAMDRVRDDIEPVHFADPVHGRIYAAAQTLIDRDQVASPITLKAVFERDGQLADIGGFAYLIQLGRAVEAMTTPEEYGRIILDMAIGRAGADVCRDALADLQAIDLDRPAELIIDEAEARLHEAVKGGTGKRGELTPVGSALAAAVEQTQAAVNAGGISGLSTGLKDLDHYLGGMRPGHLIVAAGATSMGKTDLGINIAVSVAQAGVTVAFYSLEMSADELGGRILARPTGIAASRQGRGQVSDEELAWLAKLSLEMQALPLFIDDTPAPTVGTIRSRALGLKRRRGLGFVVVDYLQLISPGNSRNRRDANRTQDVTDISRALKELAKTLGVPVLALAQLSRALEARENKRPILSDLRESGAIEQDADKVIFLYRDEYYLDRDEPKQRHGEKAEAFTAREADHRARLDAARGVAEAIIGKNRGGPKGAPKLFYDPARSFFGNLSERPVVHQESTL